MTIAFVMITWSLNAIVCALPDAPILKQIVCPPAAVATASARLPAPLVFALVTVMDPPGQTVAAANVTGAEIREKGRDEAAMAPAATTRKKLVVSLSNLQPLTTQD